MRIDWKSMKHFIDENELVTFLNYMKLDTGYYVWYYYQGESFNCLLNSGTQDYQTFVTSYLPSIIVKNDISETGIKKAMSVFIDAPKMLNAIYVAFTTSIAETNDSSGFFSIRLRDEHGQITTYQALACCTELDFCPGVTRTYGMNGGGIQALETIENDFIINAIMAPDVPVEMGGQQYLVRNIVFNNQMSNVQVAAVGIGQIPGIEGVNVLRMKVSHPQGLQKKFQINVQCYL